jgi:hypothetical protein
LRPHYYLMKNKKILRLEAETSFQSLPFSIQELRFDESVVMNQEQANWRVALFRDEIMEIEEYQAWLASPEAIFNEEELEYDFAN